ncbi:MAG: TauD/TfdA family dioxygenase [Rhodospirillaceae bacterium]|nr:TauD/TfdA family dioxygenase [Rhodospirillaceae bacterium]MBT5457713.1 TauD/TfdA family dioxygenase [Rhodospirillaceae bacterium]
MATTLKNKLEISPTGSALGARVTGVDLTQPLDADTAATLNQAWLDHIVLIFSHQDLTQEQQLAFAANFGTLGTRSRSVDRRPEGADYHDGVMLVTNKKDAAGNYVGSLPDGEMYFHHDMCYMPQPHKGTLLYAIDLPSTGGHTLFTNMYRAYDKIPEALKKTLAGRTALQVYDFHMTETVDIDGDLTGIHHLSQPIFVQHPVSGRTALYVNRLMTARVDGLPRDESDAILSELWDIAEAPENVYEHVWAEGELAMWDNYCSCHARTDFPATERRLLRRCTLVGQEMIAAV